MCADGENTAGMAICSKGRTAFANCLWNSLAPVAPSKRMLEKRRIGLPIGHLEQSHFLKTSHENFSGTSRQRRQWTDGPLDNLRLRLRDFSKERGHERNFRLQHTARFVRAPNTCAGSSPVNAFMSWRLAGHLRLKIKSNPIDPPKPDYQGRLRVPPQKSTMALTITLIQKHKRHIVFRSHCYRLADGSIGGSGKLDPKEILVGDVEYRQLTFENARCELCEDAGDMIPPDERFFNAKYRPQRTEI